MNDLGLMLAGAAARGLAVAVVGLATYAAVRRRGPAVGAAAALAGLLVLAGVALLAPCPWPRWWTLGDAPEPTLTRPASPRVAATDPGPPEGADTDAPSAALPTPGAGEWRADFAREFRRAWSLPIPSAPARHWPAWLAAAVLAAMALAGLRLAVGLLAVRALCRHSRPIDAAPLRGRADRLRDTLGIRRPVALRASPELATPAVVGWRRPTLILPEDWPSWTEAELSAALAHELAHVARGDYLAGLLAQASLALNVYNPLAHWLAARLRLEQELAADAWGARLSGGRRAYLTTLARLALRRDPRPVLGPARAFLPGRDTFLRRIQMLRDAPDEFRPDPPSRRLRAATLCALTAAGLLVAGLRGPDAPGRARAQGDPPPRKGAPIQEFLLGELQAEGVQRVLAAGAGEVERLAPDFDLTYVPADAGLVLAVRPAAILNRPEAKPLADLLRRDAPSWLQRSGLALGDVEQALFTAVPGPSAADGKRPPSFAPGAMLRSRAPRDWKATVTAALAEGAEGGAAEELRHAGKVYYKLRAPTLGNPCFFLPDDRTMVLQAREADLFRLMERTPGEMPRLPWAEDWRRLGPKSLVVGLDVAWLRRLVDFKDLVRLGVAPLWDEGRTVAAGLDLGEAVALEARMSCSSDDSGRRVAETVRAVLTLGRNALDPVRRQMAEDPPKGSPRAAVEAKRGLMDLADSLLATAQVEQEGATVRLRARSDRGADAALATLARSVVAARTAARRVQSVNNLKQIGLAMYNYNAQHGHFPPAAITAQDGTPLLSWRVAILPYLDQEALYKEFHLDEPWDSPHNKALLDRMPVTYRAPAAEAADPTHPSYFVLTGPTTVFSDADGTKIPAITDGTSMTILAVEARRDIPWTQPEDVPYDPAGPVPKLGGYSPAVFGALFGDGSVRTLRETIDEKLLRALFTRAGGERVAADDF